MVYGHVARHPGVRPPLADVARARAPHREILYGRSNWAQQRQLQLQRTVGEITNTAFPSPANPVRAEAMSDLVERA